MRHVSSATGRRVVYRKGAITLVPALCVGPRRHDALRRVLRPRPLPNLTEFFPPAIIPPPVQLCFGASNFAGSTYADLTRTADCFSARSSRKRR
jgi:hypothetical protein